MGQFSVLALQAVLASGARLRDILLVVWAAAAAAATSSARLRRIIDTLRLTRPHTRQALRFFLGSGCEVSGDCENNPSINHCPSNYSAKMLLQCYSFNLEIGKANSPSSLYKISPGNVIILLLCHAPNFKLVGTHQPNAIHAGILRKHFNIFDSTNQPKPFLLHVCPFLNTDQRVPCT